MLECQNWVKPEPEKQKLIKKIAGAVVAGAAKKPVTKRSSNFYQFLARKTKQEQADVGSLCIEPPKTLEIFTGIGFFLFV